MVRGARHLMTKIVFCADDFTGASDTLATLARAGLSTRLYLNAPAPSDSTNDLDAIGVATSLRALTVDDSVATIGPLADALARTKCGLYHFKVCSTFDSSPDIGNIAAIADRYAQSVGTRWKAVIGGQPSLRRFCLMGNLFAGAGNGHIYRIDRHPVMSVHPVTPMHEANLCRHLAAQGWPKIGLIDFTIIRKGRVALIDEIRRRLAAGECETLFDVTDDSDLLTIGDAIREIAKTTPTLCVGASSVAQALFPSFEPSSQNGAQASRRAGPVFAFAGSRSSHTAGQVENASTYIKRSIAPKDLLDPAGVKDLIGDSLSTLNAGKHLLVSLSDDRNHDIGSHALARASAAFIAQICQNTALGFLAIAGGDTSSLAVQELGINSLSFAADFDAGAPVIRAHADTPYLDGLPMLLKGGQMGKPDLFDNISALPIIPNNG